METESDRWRRKAEKGWLEANKRPSKEAYKRKNKEISWSEENISIAERVNTQTIEPTDN